MRINDNQINCIIDHLNLSGISPGALFDDVLDHYCCKVEELLEEESCSVSEAIKRAEASICPKGALQIEKDLKYLLTINQNIMLHKIVFSIASLAGFIFLLSGTAWMANLLESFVAIQLMGLSLIVAVFAVYPYLMYRLYRKSARALRQELA